jgi:hypothetical protein
MRQGLPGALQAQRAIHLLVDFIRKSSGVCCLQKIDRKLQVLKALTFWCCIHSAMAFLLLGCMKADNRKEKKVLTVRCGLTKHQKPGAHQPWPWGHLNWYETLNPTVKYFQC